MKTTLSIIHHQNTDWLRELEFYVDEIAILTTRLEEIDEHWKGDKDIMHQAKHFQNRFASLREKADNLTRDIKAREAKIEKSVENQPGSIDEKMRIADDDIFDRMAALATGVAISRYEFNRFLVKVM